MLSPGPAPPVMLFDEFLVAQEWRSLVDYVLAREADFGATEVIGGDGQARVAHDHRRSRVLYELGPFEQLFAERVIKFLPHVFYRLHHPWFRVRHLELQLTATGNGEFFRVHTDDGFGSVAQRTLTMVYFFHTEPLPFRGGELRLFATDPVSHQAVGPGWIVQPRQNQVVFFPSGLLHEILPVESAGYFAHSRFTLNGWLHT